MIDFQVAFDKLASLESADEIADFFRYEGIKAVPANSRACAITVWMEKQTGLNIATNSVVTRPVDVVLGNDGCPDYKEILGAPYQHLTPTMAEFVFRFDCDHYPDLVE